MELAPVILFVYNRPYQTNETLAALSKCDFAQDSIVYIFCDGPKLEASAAEIDKIISTRDIVRRYTNFKNVIIEEYASNRGLANSIIHGVSKVLNSYNFAIILEDDILTNKGFLKFMNESLHLYKEDVNVGCIHGWNYSFNVSKFQNTTFFLKGADCWGWATWKRSWDLFNPDGGAMLTEIVSKNLQFEFDRKGTHDFTKMLEDQTLGKNDSWAIRWHASLFLNNKFCLHPTIPIVKNIGLDGSGTHTGEAVFKQTSIEYINLKRIDILESTSFFASYKSFRFKNRFKKNWKRLKRYTKRLIGIFK